MPITNVEARFSRAGASIKPGWLDSLSKPLPILASPVISFDLGPMTLRATAAPLPHFCYLYVLAHKNSDNTSRIPSSSSVLFWYWTGADTVASLHIHSRPQHLAEASYACRTANGAFKVLQCITSQ
jgi:hypothetical protein